MRENVQDENVQDENVRDEIECEKIIEFCYRR
jgi:hypothetical protein